MAGAGAKLVTRGTTVAGRGAAAAGAGDTTVLLLICTSKRRL
jgi:hypothetical protein